MINEYPVMFNGNTPNFIVLAYTLLILIGGNEISLKNL